MDRRFTVRLSNLTHNMRSSTAIHSTQQKMSNQSLIKSTALKDVVQRDEVKERLREIMGARAPQFAAALVQIVTQSWQLQKCDPNSVIGAALTAAALDLSIDPNLGEAHIVPYGEKAQFQIGYIGFNQLAMRSGQYKNLGWKVVHEDELDSYDELSGELEVNSDHPDAPVVGYAAKFKLLNGFERGLYWTKDKCFQHAKRYSKAYNAGLKDSNKRDSVWWTDPDRACLKSVIKMLVKLWGPKSIQMQKALKVDEGAIINAETGDVEYVDNQTPPSKPDFGDAKPTVEVLPTAGKLEKPAPLKARSKPTLVESELTSLEKLNEKIKSHGIDPDQVVGFLRELGSIDESMSTLEQIQTDAPETFEMLVQQAEDILNRIKTT